MPLVRKQPPAARSQPLETAKRENSDQPISIRIVLRERASPPAAFDKPGYFVCQVVILRRVSSKSTVRHRLEDVQLGVHLTARKGLTVRRRKRRKRAFGARSPAPVLALPNPRRSLDFVHDQMATGRRFRILNIVDEVARECLRAVLEL